MADLQGGLGRAELDLGTAFGQVVALTTQVGEAITEGARLHDVAKKREQEILGKQLEAHDFASFSS